MDSPVALPPVCTCYGMRAMRAFRRLRTKIRHASAEVAPAAGSGVSRADNGGRKLLGAPDLARNERGKANANDGTARDEARRVCHEHHGHQANDAEEQDECQAFAGANLVAHLHAARGREVAGLVTGWAEAPPWARHPSFDRSPLTMPIRKRQMMLAVTDAMLPSWSCWRVRPRVLSFLR